MKKSLRNKLVLLLICGLMVVIIPFISLFSGYKALASTNISVTDVDISITQNTNINNIIIINNSAKDIVKRKKTNNSKKKKKNNSKETLESIASAIDIMTNQIDNCISLFKDIQNGGDFDTAKLISGYLSYLSSASKLADLAIPGLGTLISSGINMVSGVFFAIMGGEEATGEIQQLEDSLTQQFDDIKNQIAGLEEEIGKLSNQINESTEKIINTIYTALDTKDAQQELRKFMTSGDGNFSYNDFRNCIYGTTTNNAKASYAYNALLNEAQNEGKSDKLIKSYYDNLYAYLESNDVILYDYLCPNSVGEKSIIRWFYDVVSADSSLLDGQSAESATMEFAYELWQTQQEADMIMMGCNMYQYYQMRLNGQDCYGYSSNKIVDATKIKNCSYVEELKVREQNILNQIVSDLAYIFNLTNSYTLQNENDYYFINNNNDGNFGAIAKGQTIYLNTMYDSVCDLFEIDKDDFVYIINGQESSPIIKFDNEGQYTYSLIYKGEKDNQTFNYQIDNITIKVQETDSFSGGNGSVDSPYLIYNFEQLQNIENGLDKHYKLMADINCDGNTMAPIGFSFNSVDSDTYKPFTGSLDGNGKTISNLIISSGVASSSDFYSGFIAQNNGIIKNLKLENVSVKEKLTEANKSVSRFFVGIIAGLNNGIIQNCQITGALKNDNPQYGLDFSIDNKTTNRCIYVYAGGITGYNNYSINCCSLSGVNVIASSTHDFGGDGTGANKNNVYVGGVCGYNAGKIDYIIVNKDVSLKSSAKLIYNPKTTINPYIDSFVGGICAKTTDLTKIKNVYAESQEVSEGVLDCQSNWGEHWGNVKKYKNDYIANKKENIEGINEQERLSIFLSKEEIQSVIDSCNVKISNVEIEYNKDNCLLFETGAVTFTMDECKIKANNEFVKSFYIINVYDFNGVNTDLEQKKSGTAKVLLLLQLNNGQELITLQEVKYDVDVNSVLSINVDGAKSIYYTTDNAPSFEGTTITAQYQIGEDKIISVGDCVISDFDASEPTFMIDEDGNQRMLKKTFKVSYMDVSTEIEYSVLCIHNKMQKEYLEYKYSKEATCCEMGYTAYYCSECGQYVYRNYTPIDKHNHNIIYEEETHATCYEEGHSNKIWCDRCGEVFEELYTIPKLSHHFAPVDDTYHKCDNDGCNHKEAHQYQVTESIQEVVKNGVKQYRYVYTYTCLDCKYSYSKTDETNIPTENDSLPTIVVSNAYALNGGDEIVVYVQLINNKNGVRAANFGIRYDDELTLIKKNIEDGSLLASSLVEDNNQVNAGWNFVWGDADLIIGDGNLLKLTFKMPYKYEENKSYRISVVYDFTKDGVKSDTMNDYNGQGGFVDKDNKKQLYITKDGFITFVNHLPGDVNSDNVVDILDAIEIGKHCVGKVQVDKKYGDVNLDGNVDVVDLVIVLQSLTGGYGTNLQSQTFNLTLNLNGATLEELGLTEEELNLLISYYNENGNVNNFDLPSLERAGYKFDGWTRKIYDKDAKHIIKDGDKLSYDSNQKSQTLYAQWTLNHIIFDGNGATDGEMEAQYYVKNGENEIINRFIRQYDIVFQDTESFYVNDNELVSSKLKYEIKCWKDKDGNYYTFDDSITEWAGKNLRVIDLSMPNLGEIRLSAIWNNGTYQFGEYNLESWNTNGYKEIKWYYSTDFIELYEIDITDHNKVLEKKDFTLVAGVPRFYAEFIPITYTIQYDGNGATSGSMNPISGPQIGGGKIDINKYNTFERIGYEFKGWVDSLGNTYLCKKEEEHKIGFIDGVSNGDVVTFTAQWTLHAYNIDLYGIDVGSFSENDNTYKEKKLTTIYYTVGEGAIKEGYYLDKNFTQAFNLNFFSKYTNFDFGGVYSSITNNGHTTNNGYINASLGTQYIDANAVFKKAYTSDNGYLYIYYSPKQYTITLNTNTSSKVALSIINNCSTSTTAYYNETPKNIQTMPQGNYYKPTAFATQDGTVYFKDTGEGTKYYGISGNTTMYCIWTQKYSGTYIYNGYSIDKIGQTGTYYIIEDITWAKEWTPISEFSGTIDGMDHTISKLSITTWCSSNNDLVVGFIRINKGSIQNLNFDAVKISTSNTGNQHHFTSMGVVCGDNYGTLENIKVYNSSTYVKLGSTDYSINCYAWVGVITGVNYSKINNCHVYSSTALGDTHTKDKSADSYVGAITGYAKSGSTISNCTANNCSEIKAICYGVYKANLFEGWWSAQLDSYAGGVVGQAEGATLLNCKVTGTTVLAEVHNAASDCQRSGKGSIYGSKDGSTTVTNCN